MKKDIEIALAVPLGLIINELITNSYKYAFTDGFSADKAISIDFHPIENTSKYNLQITDNGKGLPKDFNMNTLTSYGLQLVQGLVAQLHGKMEIIQNQGTSFQITLETPEA